MNDPSRIESKSIYLWSDHDDLVGEQDEDNPASMDQSQLNDAASRVDSLSLSLDDLPIPLCTVCLIQPIYVAPRPSIRQVVGHRCGRGRYVCGLNHPETRHGARTFGAITNFMISRGLVSTRFCLNCAVVVFLPLKPSWSTKLSVAPEDRFTLPLLRSFQYTCANPDHVLLMWIYKRIISYASTGLSVNTFASIPGLTEPDPESKSGDEARPFYDTQENEANPKSAQRVQARVSIVS